MYGQVILFDKVKCVNIIQQNFEHHCKFASHVCCCHVLAPRLSQEKVNLCQMVQLLPFYFFPRKNCTVQSGAKFSPVFPVKRKALLVYIFQFSHSETLKLRMYVCDVSCHKSLYNNPRYSRIWLVLAYDLLEDRCTIDVIIANFFPLPF